MTRARIWLLRILAGALLAGLLAMLTLSFLLGGIGSDDSADRARTLALGLAVLAGAALLPAMRARWSAYALLATLIVAAGFEILAEGTLHLPVVFWGALAGAAALAWPMRAPAAAR